MSSIEPHDLAAWVALAPDPAQRELRQAIHTVLAAIAHDAYLRERMVMKGGILLAVRYQSVRYTRDIDFSTSMSLQEVPPENIRERMDQALRQAVEMLDYDLDCRVQGCKVVPANRPDASFPCIELKIGHAYKGTPKHRRLMQLQSSSVVSIDFSLNEAVVDVESLTIEDGQTVLAYGITDLVAEKIRSLLQQVIRNRYRRQDVYDLALLSKLAMPHAVQTGILQSLIRKCQARGIDPTPESLDDPEVRRRAQTDYDTLKSEVAGDLPGFDDAYSAVLALYRALPWP